MGKRKEPTTTEFIAYISRKVEQVAQVNCRVRARLMSTKKAFLKNSAESLAEEVPDHEWEIVDGEETVKVHDICYEGDGDCYRSGCCAKCGHPRRRDRVFDFGEVDD